MLSMDGLLRTVCGMPVHALRLLFLPLDGHKSSMEKHRKPDADSLLDERSVRGGKRGTCSEYGSEDVMVPGVESRNKMA